MKNALLMICTFCIFAFPVPSSGVEVRQFPYSRSIEAPTNAHRELASFYLDDQFYDRIDNNFSNIRIFDQGYQETPCLVRQKTRKKIVITENSIAVEILSLRELANNRIEIILKKKRSDPSPSFVEFSTEQHNYEKQVMISGSNNLTGWERLSEVQPLFDYSRYLDIRNNRVVTIPQNFVFYKIEISNITEDEHSPLVEIVRKTRLGKKLSEEEKIRIRKQTFHINKITFLETQEKIVPEKSEIQPYTISISETYDSKKKETVICVSTLRQPITALLLQTVDCNFSRVVKVEGTDDCDRQDSWRCITSSRISRVKTGSFSRENLKVEFNRTHRYRYYRLTIRNHDSPPLRISEIQAEGEIYEALFFKKPATQYRVFYGGKDVEKPIYDICSVLKSVQGAEVDLWTLGREKVNTDFSGEKKQPYKFEKWLFTGMMILMVIALSWLIAKITRTIEV